MFALLPILLAIPAAGAGQWPGEVRGEAVDAVTGAEVRGATLEVLGAGRAVRTDASGEFRVRGLDPGAYTVRARAPGYAETSREIEVANAEVVRMRLELPPAPLELEGVGVDVEREADRTGHRVGRAEIEAIGAGSVDAALENVPGVTIQRMGPGGAATVSVRGSGDDAVLVLVDGVPMNDPITGVADLSTLSLSAVEAVSVLPGARSARYGPGAQGGVVLIETRGSERGFSNRVGGGSLGLRSGEVEAGIGLGGWELGGAAEWREREGSFGFDQPPEVGGGEAVRENADLLQRSLGVSLAGALGGGDIRGRLQATETRRGLPGKGFAPSRSARQAVGQVRGSATWTRLRDEGAWRLVGSGALQEVTHRDPDPPFGLPYDDETRLAHGTLRGEGDHSVRGDGHRLDLSAGLEVDHQRLGATALADHAPSARTDVGGWGQLALEWTEAPGRPELSGTVRLDRDGLRRDLVASHDLTLALSSGGLSAHLAHRSAYNPPTLGDQFFREGVAVAPNPDLRAERVPGEWELGVSGSGEGRGFGLSGRLALFRADVDGMIVWSPDFRFVWSPRNVDVNRRGAEVRAELDHPRSGLRLSGSYTLARTTYDRDDPEPVQVIYRPRHTGYVRAGWEVAPGWTASARARYLGTRYPVPAPVNALPSFWSLDLDFAGRFALGDWGLEPVVRIDRALDRDDSFIFAFPEPGRTWSVELRVRSPGHDRGAGTGPGVP